jgi:serine/threonine protein kinase/Tol biopolymer transport system component
MSIGLGSRIGPYEIAAQLGEGGMGVVFRGRDSRLQRDVALKLLPETFASDADRLARFEREAQVLASLNHPNIAQIYGLENANGSTCIVMELVEGETLEERLRHGPLTFDETLAVAKQIADALAVAHERGIVHRDLKPANIKITRNGVVKVLDFGLAKALGPKAGDTSLTSMPTVASGSMVGSIVGTPGYMSPEQARGKDVDARTDIWAFGCVLYEMLTARQAFGGDTVTDILAKIVTAPPDLDLLPKDTPPSVRMLLSATLSKNATQRLQHIGDTRLFFDGSLLPAVPKEGTDAPRRLRAKLLPATLVAAIAAAVVFAFLYFRKPPEPPAEALRFELSIPNLTGQPNLSPDGKSISYGGQLADGKVALFVRPVSSDIPRQLAGTDGVNGAWWSADGQRLAFVNDGKLRTMDLAGGSSRIVGDLKEVRFTGGAWNATGDLLLSSTKDNVIIRVRESGGPATPVTKLNEDESLHVFPVFLPDGKHFVYVAVSEKTGKGGIYCALLDSNEPPKEVLPLESVRFNSMVYAQGYLVIHNLGSLTAYPMDGSGQVVGAPTVIAQDLDGIVSASNTGLLMFHKATPIPGEQLVWYDRKGNAGDRVGPVGNYGGVDLSPKGDRAAVDITANNNRDIWVIDIARAVPSRITFDAASDWTPSWSPDGERLVFASAGRDASGVTRMFEKSSTGNGTEKEILEENISSIPVYWAPKNDFIVFSRLRSVGSSGYDTWLMPLTGDRKPRPLLESPFDKFHARVSPDGRYIAFSTNESGAFQIVVQTFPDPSGGKWTISASGGVEPKWHPNGRELFFLALDGKLMSVAINGPPFSAGRVMELFQTPLSANRSSPSRDRRYDVAPDGRILIVTPGEKRTFAPFSIVVNWTAALKK